MADDYPEVANDEGDVVRSRALRSGAASGIVLPIGNTGAESLPSLEAIAEAAFAALSPTIEAELRSLPDPPDFVANRLRDPVLKGLRRLDPDKRGALLRAVFQDAALGPICGCFLINAGPAFGTVHAEEVACSLLARAYEIGHVPEAVREFRALAAENSAQVLAISIVGGLKVERSIKLTEDCELMPTAEVPGWHHLQRVAKPSHGHAEPTAAFVFRVTISPLFVTHDTERGIFPFLPRPPADRQNALLAAALASNGCAVALSSGTAHIDPRLRHLDLFLGSRPHALDRVGTIPEAYADEARLRDAFEAVRSFKTGREALERVASFLCRSRQGRTLFDRAIDLGTALEVLLMVGEGAGQNHEINHKLRTRVAWLIGSNLEQRRDLSELAATLYSLRSKAAHGAPVPDQTTLFGRLLPTARILEVGAEVCALAALSVAKRGNWPKWGDVVLGLDLDRPDPSVAIAKLRAA